MRVPSSVHAFTATLGIVLGGSLVLGACARRVETAPPEDSGTAAEFKDCTAGKRPSLFPEDALVQRLNPDFTAQEPNLEWEREARCLDSVRLRRMNETRLLPPAPGVEVYRFFWQRSFLDPVVLRLEARGGTASLVVRRGHDTAGAERLVEDRTVPVTPAQQAEFLRLLEAARFWNPPPFQTQTLVMADGATWLLEGVRDGHYRAMDAHSPDETGPAGAYRAACLYLLTLSGLQIPANEIY